MRSTGKTGVCTVAVPVALVGFTSPGLLPSNLANEILFTRLEELAQ